MRILVCLTIFVALFTHLQESLAVLIYPPFFENGEIGHFIPARNSYRRYKRNKPDVDSSTVDSAKPLCSEDKLMQFLAEIQVINPESILQIATVEALTRMCRQVSDNMDKTEKYLATCKLPSQADLYTQLIKGVESLYQKLCANEVFHKKFETYHKCLKEMSSEFENCNGPADWNEDSEPAKICAAYKDIADCYYIKAAKICGKEAAATIKELMIAIINSVVTVKCDVKSAPVVKDAMPSAYIDKTKTPTKSNLKLNGITHNMALGFHKITILHKFYFYTTWIILVLFYPLTTYYLLTI